MNFTDYIQSEEFKLFPTGKVEKKIKEKEARDKERPGDDGVRAHNMKAVKNFRTKFTSRREAGEGLLSNKGGSDSLDKEEKHGEKEDKSARKGMKHLDKRDKAGKEGDYEKSDKHHEKAVKHLTKADKHGKRRKGINRVMTSFIGRAGEQGSKDLDKQAEHNKKVKSLKRAAKKTDVEDREKAEKSAKAKAGKRKRMKAKRPKNTIKKEAMDFTDFLEHQVDPLYEVKGEMPKCPVGYKWNPKTMRCEPKTAKDEVTGPRNQKSPYGQWFYNVIGSSGYDGGWAFQEPPTPGTEDMGTGQ